MPDNKVDPSDILPVLKKIPLFAKLDENLHREIIQRIVMMYYPAEYQIFKEKEEGDALYILKTGKVNIYQEPKEEGDLPEEKAEIFPGGFFGEMALVSDEPRNASAKTAEDCQVFILSKEDFKKLLDSNPELAQQISATVVDRINKNNKPQE